MAKKKPVNIHPAANIFPMMSDKEYSGLLEDIRENGQREDCLFWREQLIDGRNRYKACMELGIEPSECMLDDDQDPVSYVISANLHRRQLSATQRAMVGAKLATLKNGQKKTDRATQNCTAQTSEDAAELLGVSPRSIATAKQVIDSKSKPLIEAVESGDVSVSLAAKLISETEDKKEIAKLVKEGPKAIREFVTPASDYFDEEEPAKEEMDCELVDVFERSEKPLSDLKRLIDSLDAHEIEVLRSWITEQPTD